MLHPTFFNTLLITSRQSIHQGRLINIRSITYITKLFNNKDANSDPLFKHHDLQNLSLIHLQPQPINKDKLPFLLTINKPNKINLKNNSKIWYDVEDPRLCSVQLFLPNKYQDVNFLQKEIIWNYRGMLKQSCQFIDVRVSHYLLNRIQSSFKHYKNRQLDTLIKRKRAKVRKHLRQLTKANLLEPESLLTILENTYGRRGSLRWELLKPYLPPSHIRFRKYRPNIKNEIQLHPLIIKLAKQQKLALTPTINQNIIHSKVRIFNTFKNHYEKLFTKIMPPLPTYIIKELEMKADLKYHLNNLNNDNPKLRSKCRKLARAYQKLLSKCPIVEQKLSSGDIDYHVSLSALAGKPKLPTLTKIDVLGL